MTAPVPIEVSRRRWRLPLTVALALAFASLALVSGIAYIAVFRGATATTERLLIDRTNRMVDAQVALLDGRLQPVTEHLELIAALTAQGRFDIQSAVDMREALAVMMSRVRGVSATAFATLDLQLHRVFRMPDGEIVRDTVSLVDNAQNYARFRDLQTKQNTFWGALFWSEQLQQPVLNVRTPVRRVDHAFIGALGATLAVGDLSYLLGSSPMQGGYFILVGDKRDQVLAHRRLIDPRGLNLSEQKPLPGLKDVDDPVLARFHDKPVRDIRLARALGTLGHIVDDAEGNRWVFVYRQVMSYGPDPWLVGRYFRIEEAAPEIDRLTVGAVVGAATIFIALLLAVIMGVRMARSIGVLTAAAEDIEGMRFDRPFYKPSRLREIDEAGHQLDRAREVLRWFEAYVPRKIVYRLMHSGEDGLVSRRRDATVMFTDIVGFTPQAEHLPETETAAMLNHHFALLGAAIEHEEGMIDKYIGDSVMAVWGAISKMEDHADAAVRAALAAVKAIQQDNEVRRASGQAPIRVRIGLHSGPVVVGNIGAPGRVNFTVVGDAVNTAQRFEQLGKEFMTDADDVIVLASGDTIRALVDLPALGIALPEPVLRNVRGREEEVEVYRLV